MSAPTPEEIATAQAAVNAKPASAVLIATERDEADGAGHRIPAGTLAWRTYGQARYDGPPDASNASSSTTYRAVHWLCRNCAQRKGWDCDIVDYVGGGHTHTTDGRCVPHNHTAGMTPAVLTIEFIERVGVDLSNAERDSLEASLRAVIEGAGLVVSLFDWED